MIVEIVRHEAALETKWTLQTPEYVQKISELSFLHIRRQQPQDTMNLGGVNAKGTILEKMTT